MTFVKVLVLVFNFLVTFFISSNVHGITIFTEQKIRIQLYGWMFAIVGTPELTGGRFFLVEQTIYHRLTNTIFLILDIRLNSDIIFTVLKVIPLSFCIYALFHTVIICCSQL